MIPESIPPIIGFFHDIKDPRIDRKKCYPLIEVIVITLLAVMAFAKGWEDIELYGKAKEAWLKQLLPLKHGIPNMMYTGACLTGSTLWTLNGVLWRGCGR
jgi:hypothetical protein